MQDDVVYNYLRLDLDDLDMEAVQSYCVRHINRRRAALSPCVFKIGVTGDPRHRFFAAGWGYAAEGYMFLDVMWAGSPGACCDLEIGLIQQFRAVPGNRNDGPGGEGICRTNDSNLGDGVSLIRAAERRRAALRNSARRLDG